jgi:hypothetical protein
MALAPALDMLPPPSKDRHDRPVVMIVAHLVYGIVSGWAASAISRRPWFMGADAAHTQR